MLIVRGDAQTLAVTEAEYAAANATPRD